MTTEAGKTRAREMGSGRAPKAATSATATATNPTAPAALSAANPTAPTAFTAPATGGAISVTTADAADLTTVGDALEVLRDEVALYELQISAIIADNVVMRTEIITYETAISALILDVDTLRAALVAVNIVAA